MNDSKFRELRKKMVEEQLKTRGIKEKRVLEAFCRVPRHLFVDTASRALAYEDHPLPIGKGQTISQPYIVALMTEALGLKGDEKVLEVGTGSGYQAAVLAELAGAVYTVERISGLQKRAREILDSLGYNNISYKIGDGSKGWPEEAPFDGILVTAAAAEIPEPLLEQLALAGCLVIPVGGGLIQDLLVIKRGRDGFERSSLGGCRFVPLV